MSARVTISTPQRLTSAALQNPRARPLLSPSSPHTPINRPLSFYNTPQSPFRADDEALVVTIGCRTLLVGFAGENAPRAVLGFGADTRKRVGDWSSAREVKRKKWTGKEEDEWRWWGSEDELWRIDCRECDFTLMEAKFQRALRTAMVDHVLAEPKSRKIFLGVPTDLPYPVFERVVANLFAAVQAVPSVTVMPHAVLAAVGAGLRAALVVDIGWNEAVVTAVVDLREVLVKRSDRAGKMLSFAMRNLLDDYIQHARQAAGSSERGGIAFEDVEEVLTRAAWCNIPNEDETRAMFAIPSLPSTKQPIELPFSALALPAESVLFPTENYDEHDLPLPQLLYDTLLAIPIDARRVCMSRIIFTGGVSNLPGIKSRTLRDLEAIISTRGWEKVKDFGSAKDKINIPKSRQRQPLSSVDPNVQIPKEDPEEPLPASERPQELDIVSKKLEQLSLENEKETTGGFVRSIDSVGAWAGASLIANLRIKGPEIEREKFSSHGLGCLGGDYAGWIARIGNHESTV